MDDPVAQLAIGRDCLQRRRFCRGAGSGEIGELGQPLQIALGREQHLDLPRLAHRQRRLSGCPEQAGVFGCIHCQLDRAGAKIGKVEARVERPGKMRAPARKGH